MSQEKIYSFSESESQKFVSNHLDKLVWVAVLFLFVYPLVMVGRVSIYSISFLLIICFLAWCFGRIQRKFAHNIILDFNKQKAFFHMSRGGQLVDSNFSNIREIHVNGYIIFNLKDRKIFYANSHNIVLLNSLSRISRISWGYLCNLWGPPRKIRDQIDNNR